MSLLVDILLSNILFAVPPCKWARRSTMDMASNWLERNTFLDQDWLENG